MSNSPEKQLWQAVVVKAVLDALAENPSGDENKRAKADADAWLRNAGRDFHMVCHMAGFDPQFIAAAYREGRINRELLRAAEKTAA